MAVPVVEILVSLCGTSSAAWLDPHAMWLGLDPRALLRTRVRVDSLLWMITRGGRYVPVVVVRAGVARFAADDAEDVVVRRQLLCTRCTRLIPPLLWIRCLVYGDWLGSDRKIGLMLDQSISSKWADRMTHHAACSKLGGWVGCTSFLALEMWNKTIADCGCHI